LVGECRPEVNQLKRLDLAKRYAASVEAVNGLSAISAYSRTLLTLFYSNSPDNDNAKRNQIALKA